MLLTKIIDKNISLKKTIGKRVYVKGISSDSRKVKPGMIFATVKGKKYDGINYTKHLIKLGINTFLCEQEQYEKLNNEKVNILVSKNIRLALANIARKFSPKQPKNIVAITGTNGKTSVVHYLNFIFKKNNYKSASIGTLGIKYEKKNKHSDLTTPDPITLHKNVDALKKKGVNYLAIEASSHALDQNRIDALNINCAVFTNLSRDHLDYHLTIEKYFKSKERLFSEVLNKKGIAIVNKSDKYGKRIIQVCKKNNIKTISFGINTGDWSACNLNTEADRTKFNIKNNKTTYEIECPIFAKYQIENLLTAIVIAKHYGIDVDNVIKSVRNISLPNGRLTKINTKKTKNTPKVFIDYAHTPVALKKSLLELRKILKRNGKLVLVFGCGGNRDRGKRKEMAQVANTHADKVYVTDDNPRNESASQIRNDITSFCEGAISIGNRKKAIFQAIKSSGVSDILLIAGKGHEKYQEVKGKIIPFDDKAVAKKIILGVI